MKDTDGRERTKLWPFVQGADVGSMLTLVETLRWQRYEQLQNMTNNGRDTVALRYFPTPRYNLDLVDLPLEE